MKTLKQILEKLDPFFEFLFQRIIVIILLLIAVIVSYKSIIGDYKMKVDYYEQHK